MAEENTGKVKIDTEVLASIAGVAAMGVPGVHRIKTGLVAGITHLFRKRPDAGIHVVVGEGEVSFTLSIVVDYGVNIPEVTFQVQKKIREEVEKMSGLKVSRVDVLVRGVNLSEKRSRKND
ncbi:MAG: Asp23/Gls24 family envelope stress response protein [Candidatus Omnitrophica bacterium]|nr:Asp23/Gls24 family envelope stress response protein [Candidatus Omnitrophota bacterium]